jgi:hypothetical protein
MKDSPGLVESTGQSSELSIVLLPGTTGRAAEPVRRRLASLAIPPRLASLVRVRRDPARTPDHPLSPRRPAGRCVIELGRALLQENAEHVAACGRVDEATC